FRLAAQQPDSNALYKVRWGMLLHERFNNREAADLFREALAKDPSNASAYLGLAIISAESFDGKATEYAAKAIMLNPKLAEAHELMAHLALENDDRELAIAAADLLADRSPDAWFAKITAINPGYGEAYTLVADQLELHYRYEDAATYYRKAIAANPQLWSAHSALGIDL